MASSIRAKRTTGTTGDLRQVRKGRILLAAVGACLLAFLIFTLVVMRDYLAVAEVTLPNTVGMNYNDAVAMLEQLGVEVGRYTENVEGAAINTVTSQNPAPGTGVRRGRSVSLGVNIPVENIRVPLLVGLDLERANRLVQDLGLRLGTVRYEFSDAPRSEVLSQSPQPGEVLSTDSSISLILSRGPEPSVRELPDVQGMRLEEARRRLEEAGFRRIETVATSLSFSRPGLVTSQRPAPGQRLTASTPVVLEYALSSRRVVPVPNLQGLTLSRAQFLLRAADLEIAWDALSYINDPNQPGGIVEYQPTNYTLAGTPVVLTVNGSPTGANAPQRLPGQEGDRFADDPLGGGGFGTAEGAFPDTGGTGGFFSDLFDFEQPPAGTDGRESTREEREELEPLVEGARRVPIKFVPADYGLPANQTYEFVLRIKDERGDRVGVQRTLPPGSSVDTSVVVYGETLLQIELDGTVYTAWNPY